MNRLSLFHFYAFGRLNLSIFKILVSLAFIGLFLGVNFNICFGQTKTIQLTMTLSQKGRAGTHLEPQIMDHRYSPLFWQSSICLPDDPQKTVIGSDGTLNYNYKGGYDASYRMQTWIFPSLVGANSYTPVHQELYSARIPIVITEQKMDHLVLHEEAWARAPEYRKVTDWAPRRVDYLWLKMQNRSSSAQNGKVVLKMASKDKVAQKGNALVTEDNPKEKILTIDPAPAEIKQQGDSLQIYFPQQQLPAGEEYQALDCITTCLLRTSQVRQASGD